MGSSESKVETYIFSVRPGEAKYTQRADDAHRKELKKEVKKTKQFLSDADPSPSSSPKRNVSPKKGTPKSQKRSKKEAEEKATESESKNTRRNKKAKGLIAAQKVLAQGIGSKQLRSTLSVSATCPWLLKTATFGTAVDMSSRLEMEDMIGVGLMGRVRVAKYKSGQYYLAVKSISKWQICKRKDGRHLRNELDFLTNYASMHPFIVNFFGTSQDESYVHFFLEYCAGGELFSRLMKKLYLRPQIAKFYAVEICEVIAFIHSIGWVYRDLKPENVLLDEEGHIRLIDFGFSRQPNADTGLCKTICGTPAYLSPEVLNGKFQGYTEVVDWWAFGCVIFEMMVGTPPFCRNNQRESNYAIYLRILKGKISFPRKMHAPAKDLVRALLDHDLERRLTDVRAIQQQPFLEADYQAVRERRAIPPFVPSLKAPGDRRYFDEYNQERIFARDERHKLPGKNGKKVEMDESIFAGF